MEESVTIEFTEEELSAEAQDFVIEQPKGNENVQEEES